MNVLVSPQSVASLKTDQATRIVIVGDVDHGKSTLIGRLLYETGSLPDGKFESLKAMSARRGMPFEWSFLLDALQTERDQGITIDTSQIRFRTALRDFVLIDAPGHIEFLRNMITGAAQADAALLLIDAVEGVREQTRRHGYLLHLLGIRQAAVIVNKMDRVGYSAERFREIADEIGTYLGALDIEPVAVVPISAREGDGITVKTPAIAWHDGPTVTEALDQLTVAPPLQDLDLRLPVQAVYKFDDRRIIAGRIESGRIAVGDEIVVLPGNKSARVKSIEGWPVANDAHTTSSLEAGRSVGVTLDRELFIERGHILALASAPAPVVNGIRARIFWLHSLPLAAGTPIVVRSGTAEIRGRVSAIVNSLDPADLQSAGIDIISQNRIGEVDIALATPAALDTFTNNPLTGRFAIEIDGRIAGGGIAVDVKRVGAGHRNTENLQNRVAALLPRLQAQTAAERLASLRDAIDGRIVFTTSFGIEDQAILHMIAKGSLDIDIVTLDTGRLFPQTHDLWAETERHFGIRIKAFYPRHDELETLVERQGINGFYENREARQACCFARKVEPLDRALANSAAWIAGLRADQSTNRQDMALISADKAHGLIKLSPLFDWSREQVAAFTSANGIPVNALHDKGFASIGCAPCTRALRPGEPERAGRWWWEDETKKECGLHLGR
ncbi:phosphoadenylyl-sulfate reductase [Undibacter mobilis]|uniref:Adenosine 5'-phosphosulfate reductase n=1 Tax=Undibacter mobilis TaxID=2292256 RepID=A0A371BAG3_9BRAD|nr:phosphoadenylyl-sulfate reductase [Undibacter mobilis]RDV04341.1 phosphoadenylyl-sulfate reductase [Undibacter mobilis]